MCRRIRQSRQFSDWIRLMDPTSRFHQTGPANAWTIGVESIENPTTIVSNHKGTLNFDRVMWGRPMPWNKLMVCYHARDDKLFSSAWAGGTKKNRILVPCDAWREGDAIFESDQLFNLAGLRFTDGFVVVTVPSTTKVERYHARIPLMLNAEDSIKWLARGTNEDGIRRLISLNQDDMIKYTHKPLAA